MFDISLNYTDCIDECVAGHRYFCNRFESRVSKLSLLTPGDSSTVMRQSRFRRINDNQDLYSRLVSECALKGEGNNR